MMDRQTELSVLAGTEIFRTLPTAALEEIRQAAFRKRVATGEAVYFQDDPVTSVYIVAVGRLRVVQSTPDGQQVTLRYLGPGEIAGYAALSDETAYPGTAVAIDDTHLIGWSREVIRHLMASHGQIAINAIAVLTSRYQETQLRLREQSTENVERRVAHTILRLVAKAGRRTAHGIEIGFPLTRQDLAEMAGTTLHTVSRILSTWERQGIVLSGRRRIMLCIPHELTAIAESA